MCPTGIRAVASGSGAIGSRTAQAHQIFQSVISPKWAMNPRHTAEASPHFWGYSTILPIIYALMEPRMCLLVEPQAGRRRGGLWHGGGSSDSPPAPAGPHDLSSPPTAVPTG